MVSPRIAACAVLAAAFFGFAAFNPRLPLLLFSALSLCAVMAMPQRDATRRQITGILIVAGSTLACYAAPNMTWFAAAWAVSAVPFVFGMFRGEGDGERTRANWLVPLVLIFSAGAVAMGAAAPSPSSALALFALAVFLRKGMFPLHVWVVATFERGPLIPAALLFNGHLGAQLLARTRLPEIPVLGNLALASAVCTALIALVERRPRRLLALLSVSQASCILAGLESGTPEGAAGALAQWLVVAAGSMGMACVYRILEVRVGEQIDGRRFIGLAAQFPRLCVFFAVSGLAMVGLPGTLGFCAEDLLMHGVLESHPIIGLAQPLATALNAFSMLRLFAFLFLGARSGRMSRVPDALPRERFALAAVMLFLLAGGLAPRWIVSSETAGFAAASKENREELTRAHTWSSLSGFGGDLRGAARGR